ncbi:MAG: hypothetical protein H0V12_00410 [Chloroflexi bacterium]|nr:hypothetical protein [Chloroflexota bacterium]
MALLAVLFAIGCLPTEAPVRPTEPPIHGEPLPGSFHLTSDPPLAPFDMTIRVDHVDGPGPSGRNAQFDAGEEVVVNWADLPLPREKWIEVNGLDCEGTFGIRPRFEIDLLLTFTDNGCAIDVLGSHPEDVYPHGPAPTPYGARRAGGPAGEPSGGRLTLVSCGESVQGPTSRVSARSGTPIQPLRGSPARGVPTPGRERTPRA